MQVAGWEALGAQAKVPMLADVPATAGSAAQWLITEADGSLSGQPGQVC